MGFDEAGMILDLRGWFKEFRNCSLSSLPLQQGWQVRCLLNIRHGCREERKASRTGSPSRLLGLLQMVDSERITYLPMLLEWNGTV